MEQHEIITEALRAISNGVWVQVGYRGQKKKRNTRKTWEVNIGQTGERLFLFHSNLDVQGLLCVTGIDVFIYFCLLMHVDICFPSPPAPSALVVWKASRKGHCRVSPSSITPTEPPSEHSLPVDWLVNHQPEDWRWLSVLPDKAKSRHGNYIGNFWCQRSHWKAFY